MANTFLEEIINDKDANRMVSPFQCLKLQDKIRQYALTSSNIIFGNCLEKDMKSTLEQYGATYVERHIENYDFDQLCIIGKYIILIEQKVKDDHDSTKKVGQIQNYLIKKELIKQKYPDHTLISSMWFIDPSFTKNYNYYSQQIREELVYGEDIFKRLQSLTNIDFSMAWETFLEKMYFTKQNIQSNSSINIIANNPIEINNVSLSKLYDYMSIGSPKEIIEIFFANQDYSDKILEACNKSRQTSKIRALKELVNNGYFK
jgi:hypothetical protein